MLIDLGTVHTWDTLPTATFA